MQADSSRSASYGETDTGSVPTFPLNIEHMSFLLKHPQYGIEKVA